MYKCAINSLDHTPQPRVLSIHHHRPPQPRP
jgi:hypothetical protein